MALPWGLLLSRDFVQAFIVASPKRIPHTGRRSVWQSSVVPVPKNMAFYRRNATTACRCFERVVGNAG